MINESAAWPNAGTICIAKTIINTPYTDDRIEKAIVFAGCFTFERFLFTALFIKGLDYGASRAIGKLSGYW